jgi:choline dehydrogenase-like flavoprotein
VIFDASTLTLPLRIDADLCVIGSGAGGMAAATVAAEAGLKVVVLEAGGFVPPERMTQREEEMLPQLLVANGGQTTADRAVRIVQGRAVGGSTVHNINLCGRIPDPIRREWARTVGLKHLPAETWTALYDEVEALLGVSEVPEARWNRHNRLLAHGANQLGWRHGGLRHNRTGCQASGFCLLGCAYDAKNNACKVLLPRLIAAGGQVLSQCRAVRIEHGGGAVRAVEAVALDPVSRTPAGRIEVIAPKVCVSASATGTAALLLRSKVPDPSGKTGRTLRIHPAPVAAGEFDDPVNAWTGIPQTVDCTEFLNFEAAHPEEGPAPDVAGNRTWILPAFAHPVGTATMVPGLGAEHRRLMERYARLAVLTPMIHDLTVGRVRPLGDLGLRIDYRPIPADRREAAFGLVACARLLFAAGAQHVYLPSSSLITVSRDHDLDALEARLTVETPPLTAVHPMSSVPMGDDPARSPVGSDGRHHHVEGLYVADGSLFPTSIGVPPQVSIYAMGLHVGRAIADA